MSTKKRNHMAKNKKDFYSEEEIKRRVKEHNYDRTCYANKSICSKVETYSKICARKFGVIIIAAVL